MPKSGALCFDYLDFKIILLQVRSVGNTLTLHETALIEAFNLKAAIEYVLKNTENAREALTDMPPRSEDELDAVTLHNQVLCRCLHKSLEAPGWS